MDGTPTYFDATNTLNFSGFATLQGGTAADVVVLLQAHSVYDLDDIARRAVAVFDTRGVMSGDNVERL